MPTSTLNRTQKTTTGFGTGKKAKRPHSLGVSLGWDNSNAVDQGGRWRWFLNEKMRGVQNHLIPKREEQRWGKKGGREHREKNFLYFQKKKRLKEGGGGPVTC